MREDSCYSSIQQNRAIFLECLIPTTSSFCYSFSCSYLSFFFLLQVAGSLFAGSLSFHVFKDKLSFHPLTVLQLLSFHCDSCTVSVLSEEFCIFPSSFNMSSSSKTLLFYILLQLIALFLFTFAIVLLKNLILASYMCYI